MVLRRADDWRTRRQVALAWTGLFVLGLVLRLIWWRLGAFVIENEGSNYARVGENLAAGRGYLGLDELGPQLIYPPLYPGLIAVGVRAGLSSEFAGRAASLLCGAFAPIVFALIARRLYGSKAGWYTGLVAAFHPLLVAASVAVLSESVYLTFVLLGIFQVLGQMDRPRYSTSLAGGAFLGLAYLCRPEALFLTVVLALIIIAANRATARKVAAMLAVFALFALPYVLFLHEQTGQWRVEAKTPQGIIYQVGALAGRTSGELFWRIDEDLNGQGLSNTSDVAQARFVPPPAVTRAKIAVYQAISNTPQLLRGLAHLQFGGPMFSVLVGLGIFAAAWNGSRVWRELPMLAVMTLIVGPYLIWPFTLDRSLFMLMAPFVVWAGYGLLRLQLWASDSAKGLRLRASGRGAVMATVLTVVVPSIAATSFAGVRETDELSQSWSNLADFIPVGRWLGEEVPHARIADTGPTVAFYSGAALTRFPWTDGPTAIRYLERSKVDFVVLRESTLTSRPYLRDWFAQVPDRRLELAKTFAGATGMTRIYRWNEGSSESPLSSPVELSRQR